MQLNFQVQGEGLPLIVLHGFLGSLENWQSMSKRLAALYKVYSVDLRNHGRSPHSRTMNYPVMAQDVREFIDGQGLAPPMLMGHSMGGKVAMQLATQHPDEIENLIVVDIAPRAYPPAHRPILTAMSAADLAGCKSFGAVGAVLAAAIPDPAVRQFVLKNLERDASGGFRWRIGLAEISENYNNLTAAIAPENRFEKPACFIRGELSDFIEQSDLAPIRKIFPKAEFHSIPRAGHWVHIANAGDFYTAASDFLTAERRF